MHKDVLHIVIWYSEKTEKPQGFNSKGMIK